MKRKVFIQCFLTGILGLVLSSHLLAAMPPPVNQEIGFFETRFNNLTTPECRACHNQNPPDGIPVDPTYLPDRHHLLVGTTINPPTVVPYPDSDGDLVADTTYQCLNCHSMTFDGFTWVMDQNFRDCMDCHQQLGGDHHGSSPHHNTPLAQADLDNDGIRDTNADGDPVTYCSECHGSLVNDLGDGHFIPTYTPSLVTPWPSGKVNGDSSTVNDRGTEAGNCDYCHDSGIAEDGREIVYNMLSHHGAGFFVNYLGEGPCYWCHIAEGEDEATKIRKCEGCHGPESLHNIQVDSDGDSNINPGAEQPFYGHIGSNDDCWGCHGYTSTAVAAPYSGPTVPSVESFSRMAVNEGEDTLLVINGLGFTNTVEGPTGLITLTSIVTLEAEDGTITTLAPDTINQSLIEVTIPSSMNAGIYALRVEKNNKYSNKETLLIKPRTVVRMAICRGTGISITGENFSQYLDAVDSGTSLAAVDALNNPVDCTVRSWKNNKITATCNTCPSSVAVDSIWGESIKRSRKMRPRRR